MLEELADIKEITLELTNKCDLRCKICNIWKEKNKKDLSLGDIKRALEYFRYPITISLTGGEPLLNHHIDKIYKYLYKLFLQHKIKDIDIATNAYSDKIVKFIKNNKDYLQPLSLSISIDGIEKNHNIQRGKDDAFKKTLKNILTIKKYNIPITIKFVISKINYKDLMKVYKLSEKIGCIFNVKFFEIVPNYYHRKNKYPKLNLNSKGLSIIKNSIKEIDKAQNSKLSSFTLLWIKKLLRAGNLNCIKKCLTPQYSLFITCYGDVYSCVYQEKIGNIKNWPNLNWEKHKKILENARKGKCPKCLSYHGYLKEFNFV